MAIDITWKKFEKDIKTGDVDTQRKATEAFLEEREKQTSTSAKARAWEKDRKAEIEKNKPLWRKEKFEAKEEARNKNWNNLLKGGAFEADLIPSPGYILIGVDQKETRSESGIIISQQEEPNEGVVLVVGKPLVLETQVMHPPCNVGDNILYKRGAGLNLIIKDRQTKLIYFPDVLGVFK